MRLSTAWWLVSASLLVAGCGGSGSNNSTPPPPVAPTVTAVAPASASTGVAVGSTLTATFSAAMSASTITSSTFTLAAQGGSAVTGTVSYSSSSLTATFTPSAPLANNTSYTATLTTGVTNSSGTALAADYTWSFTTAPAPPTVTAVAPAAGTTGVAVASILTATFSAAMQSSTITTSTFTLAAQGGAAVTGTVSYNSGNLTATFIPGVPLAYSTTYTATITTGAMSSAGSALAANYTWSFTTAAAPPPAPFVTAVTPANTSTNVAVATPLTATFSTAMNAATITASTFTLAEGGTAVQGNVSYNAATNVATFNPSANLMYGTTYTATITTGAASAAGIAPASNYMWSFTTVAAPVPTVVSTVPANNASNVNVSNALTATFSQFMNSSTITGSTFTLTGPGATAVAGLISYNSVTATATFTPSSALAYGTTYTATITTAATSSAGAALASNYVWSFTTGSNPNQVTVNFGTTYQTIRGFGGSTAWLGKMPQAVATALFSPTSGLGLNILRVRIDPTGSASSNPPFVTTDQNGSDSGAWTDELANAREAFANNPKAIVFASPWTPPANWKLNGTTTTVDGTAYNEALNSTCGEGPGYCGGYLDPNHYADYANYLEDFVNYFNANAGFNLYAISMQNEPEENVAYESCVWTPQQMDTWVASNASTITSDPYSTKLIMPESDVFNPVDAATALSDPNAQAQISIIGGHIYQTLSGGSITPYPALPAGDTPKELWMTEFGPLTTYQPPSSPLTYTDVFPFAESLHNSMVTGQYNAFVWWGIFGAPTNAGSWGLVDNNGNPTVFGYAVGQYSRFIQPGYVRVSATANPVSGVYVSAYTGDGHFVIVAINSNATAQNLSFALTGGAVTSLSPYQTTSAAGLAAQAPVSVSGGQFNSTLPAQSIVTFVQ